MKIACPHCSQILELTVETLDSFGGDPHFACPVCAGLIAVPVRAGAASPPPKKPGPGMPGRPKAAAPMSKPTAKNPSAKKPTQADAILAAHRGLHRNIRVLGIAVFLLLGGLGIYLAITLRGDTHMTREEHLREIIRNQFFTDLIASGATTKKALLGLWDIQEHGVGFVGISEDQCAWPKANELAQRVGASVLTLDPPDTATRAPMLHSLTGFSADLGDATFWLLDHGEPKVLHAPEVDRVTTLDRPRRVLLAWSSRPNKK